MTMTAAADFPRVTLFFITFNQRDIAVQTLRDAIRQDYPLERISIVVLDDGSTDGSYHALVTAAAGAAGRCEIIADRHVAHYRSAALWNRCIDAAPRNTDIFVQVDDVRLRPDFVRRHVTWHRLGPPVVVTGAKFEGPEETWELTACRRNSLAAPGGGATFDVPPTAVWGASLSYDRRLLKEACTQPSERPYDELMNGYGHHEVEFAYRLLKAGARTVYDPAAGVFHCDHDPIGERRRGMDRHQLIAASLEHNAAYICAKHGLPTLPRW